MFWNEILTKLITYGVVLFLKKGYMWKNVTEWFRRLNRARDLRFSLKCASFLHLDHFFIEMLKIISEERMSKIVVIITWIYHFTRAFNIEMWLLPVAFTKVCVFSPSWSFSYLNFKSLFRRTNEQNCCYNYLNLSF